MNALTLLKNDHKKVEDLFKRYEKLGDRAEKSKAALVKEMIRELSVHANIEETVFYPETRERVKEVEDEVLEGLEEHHVAKWTLYELSKMKPSDERFDPKVKVMMESVRHHVEEEETAIFPPVREKLTPRELDEIGARLEKARKIAPKQPHPRMPDEPPANITASAALAPPSKAKAKVKKELLKKG